MLWSSKWFPGTNLQDLNLDWILKKVSALRGGSMGQYLYKKSDKDFDFGWKTSGGGGGGTSDYLELDNKPSINNVELVGNKTAADLGLAASSDIPEIPVQSVNGKTGAVVLSASDVGAYVKPATGIPKTDLANDVQTSLNKADSALQAVPPTYRTATSQDAIDATQDAAIGVVITGNRPSRAVSAGKYVIVRNSTISGISDGLYTSNSALSPSTDVTAANLSAVLSGGLNMVAPISLGGTGANAENQARVNLETAFVRRFVIGGGATLTLSCSGVQACLMVAAGTATTRHGLYIVGKVTSDESSPIITTIYNASGLVLTAGNASITVQNSAGSSVTLICITTAYNNLPTEA